MSGSTRSARFPNRNASLPYAAFPYTHKPTSHGCVTSNTISSTATDPVCAGNSIDCSNRTPASVITPSARSIRDVPGPTRNAAESNNTTTSSPARRLFRCRAYATASNSTVVLSVSRCLLARVATRFEDSAHVCPNPTSSPPLERMPSAIVVGPTVRNVDMIPGAMQPSTTSMSCSTTYRLLYDLSRLGRSKRAASSSSLSRTATSESLFRLSVACFTDSRIPAKLIFLLCGPSSLS